MASQVEETHYHPQDAIGRALKTTLLTGGVGLFASSVQNTLTRRNVGPWGVFVRTGGTIGIFGLFPFYSSIINSAVIDVYIQRLWAVLMNS